jgi:hypothetical protein
MILALLTTTMAGCRTSDCAKGTILIELTLSPLAATATEFDVSVTVEGVTVRGSSPRQSTSLNGTLEISFPHGYPSQKTALITIVALVNGKPIATGSESILLAAACETSSVTLGRTPGDFSAGDMASRGDASGDGGAEADLSARPILAVARLVSPSSTSIVTQQQPTLRWVLSSGAGSVFVDLCSDRACNVPGTTAPINASGDAAVPSKPLPPGWVYWRVRVTDGVGTTSSAIWQFWVGKQNATGITDTTTGSGFDVNGDGLADVFIVADGATAGGGHLYLSQGGGTFNRLDLTDPFAGRFLTVVNAGDVNGDGFGDFIILSYASSSNTPFVRIYFGSQDPSAADWNAVNSLRRVDLTGPDSTGSDGRAVAGVGDVNRDGYADFIVGSPTLNSSSGVVHVYFGESSPSAADWTGATAPLRMDLTDPDGANATFGISVGGGGDVNGDGYADFLVSALDANSSVGAAHLYFGEAKPVAGDWNGTAPPKRFDLTSVTGAMNSDFGAKVQNIGDVNNDGYSDFAISETGASNGNGACYVYLGEPLPTAGDWNGGGAPRRINVFGPDMSQFGASVSSAGDINGDGYADFVVGAPGTNNTQSGEAHVYLGTSSTNGVDWNGASAAKRITLVGPDGADALFGHEVAPVGDVNGDGYSDFLVSAWFSSAGGIVHLFLGEATPVATDWVGGSATKKIDFLNPDGAGANFGESIASMRPRKVENQSAAIALLDRDRRHECSVSCSHVGVSERAPRCRRECEVISISGKARHAGRVHRPAKQPSCTAGNLMSGLHEVPVNCVSRLNRHT